MRKLNKKITAAVAGTALALVASGVAFAYWTNTGSGAGSASTGTNEAITVNQTSPVTGLYPGGPAGSISGTFTNPNAGKVYVAQVTVAVKADFSAKADASKPACTAADFAITPAAPTNAEVTTGSTWGGATIALKDLDTNQDNCKGVTPELTLTSS